MAQPTATPPQPPDQGRWWRVLSWAMVGLLVAALYQSQRPGGADQIAYTAFKQAVREGRVSSVRFEGDRLTGTFAPAGADAAAGTDRGAGGPGQPPAGTARFKTVMPAVADRELMDLLEREGVIVRAESTATSMWMLAFVNLLPWMLLIGLVVFSLRRMRQDGAQGQGGLFGIARSPAKRFEKSATRATFKDVAGLEAAKADLQEIIGCLREPERYRKLGAKIPRGLLMMGPPGTGKTLLAKAVAGEANVPFFSIVGSQFIEMFVGVGASRVRDMFETAKREAPAILFIDEIDAVGRTRGTGVGGGHDEREQTLNQILAEMDGFSPSETVIVIAATNRPDVLDPALLRPGRFDRKVVLQMPDRRARRHMLAVHTRRVPLADDVDLDAVAARTVGFSGADVENLVNEAALLAARHGREAVDTAALEEARDKILLGAAGEVVLNDEQKRLVAYHESGHALLAWLLPHADPLEKVTIIPRGRALGVTAQTPEEDRHHHTESYLRSRIEVMLGGRVSEKLVYGEVTSGSEQDLKQATQLARRMVSQWGMSERIGAVAFRRGEQHVFLGQEMAQEKDYSERTAQLIDEEIRRVVGELERHARQRLEENRHRLDALVEALLDRETLGAIEIRDVLQLDSAAARLASG